MSASLHDDGPAPARGRRPAARLLAALRGALHLRLSLVLLALFALLALGTLAVFSHFSRTYQDEVMQRLNRDVAAYIAKEHRAPPGRLDTAALQPLFDDAMIFNPVLELYVLDPAGRVLTQGPAAGGRPPMPMIEQVPLAPLRAFLAGAPLPLFAVDPRTGMACVFSVAPIGDPAQPLGYVYAVLASSASEAAMMAAGGSQGLTLAAASITACVLFLGLTGALLFRSLTGRLRELADRVGRFTVGTDDHGVMLPREAQPARGHDEIARLAADFDAMAARIAAQVALLEAIDRGRREAVLNASHDLRTPLAALQGYLQTLQLKGPQLSEAQKANYLEIAQRHAARLNRLVEQMFALAKLDAPEAAPVRERFSAAELAGDVVQKFALRAGERGVTLAAAIDPDAPLLTADIGMIERLLENLVENALKFTPAGGRVQVQVRRASSGGMVLEVQDSGRGMAGADLPRIYDRFYRASRTDIESDDNGSGLGLAIVRRIVDLHDARIDVDSRVGHGTRFTVTFPP